MLILSRKVDEVITIGDTIRIKVLAVHEGQVKLGIDAPKDVKVFRSEVYELIQRQNMQAMKTSKSTAQKAAGLLKQVRRKSKDT
ncbi:MAG: carbon storage regulator CsrA [Ignavibacteriales bacterium]|nr:carbon storage regulator CsrA [Ignavibacteriales bacterium]MBI3787410.1 carbon storage regulator CsrA [Ignavibacteriales bacterium]